MLVAPFVLSGEIDLANAEQIGEELHVHVAGLDDTADVLIDCTGLMFIDSSGLAMLMATVERTGKHLVLKGVSDACRRPFELTGLDQVFEIE